MFDYPEAAYLLILTFPLIFLLISVFRYRKRMLSAYADPSHLNELLLPRARAFKWIKSVAWVFVWVASCLALIGPKGNLRYTRGNSSKPFITEHMPQNILFLVDTSGSMAIPDARNGVTRLENGKEIMQEIIAQLNGQSVELDALSSSLIPLVPSTLDYLFTRIVIGDLQIDEGDEGGGTDFSSMFHVLGKETPSDSDSQSYVTILFSDGGDNAVESLEGEAKVRAIASLQSMLQRTNGVNQHFFTVGLGSIEGGIVPHVTFNGRQVRSELQEDLLKKMAEFGYGTYYRANDWPVWNLAHDFVEKIGKLSVPTKDAVPQRRVKLVEEKDVIYDLYYQIPLGIALMLLLLIYVLPDTRVQRL